LTEVNAFFISAYAMATRIITNFISDLSSKAIEDDFNEKQPLTTVANSSLITSDFNHLIYLAPAALHLLPVLDSNWLQWQGTQSSSLLDSKIIASPYNDSQHLLDLNHLSLEDRIFALALTTIRPVKSEYATLDLTESLNISEVNDMIRRLGSLFNLTWKSKSYYLVIFRSKMKEQYDNTRLFDLDKHSHREAMESGGLLKYWFGTVNDHRQNLAFCRLNLPMQRY
jgi:hypothetical protein